MWLMTCSSITIVVKYPLQTNMPTVINNPLCLPVHCSSVYSLAPPLHTFRGRDSCSFIILAYMLTAVPQIQTAQRLQAQTHPNKHTVAAVCSCAVWSLGSPPKAWDVTGLLGNSCAFPELICAMNHKAAQSSCLSVNQCNLRFATFTLCASIAPFFDLLSSIISDCYWLLQ